MNARVCIIFVLFLCCSNIMSMKKKKYGHKKKDTSKDNVHINENQQFNIHMATLRSALDNMTIAYNQVYHDLQLEQFKIQELNKRFEDIKKASDQKNKDTTHTFNEFNARIVDILAAVSKKDTEISALKEELRQVTENNKRQSVSFSASTISSASDEPESKDDKEKLLGEVATVAVNAMRKKPEGEIRNFIHIYSHFDHFEFNAYRQKKTPQAASDKK